MPSRNVRPLLALLLAALLATTVAAPAAASHPRPTPTVLQSGLVVPWDLDFLPGGEMVVTERPGRIRIYASAAPGAELLKTVTVPEVRAEHEAGLMGIAVDRDFANNPFIYVCASRDADGTGPAPWLNQLLRYRITPQLDAVAEGTLIADGMRAHTQHNGCAVEMDAARRLWLTMGDGGVSSLAQDPTSLNGKVLRIHADGTIPDDNPILPGQSEASAVYTLGHRNPQGLAFDPISGQPYAVEHGPNRDDEINRLVAGANYGWPCYTGSGTPHLTTGCGPATDYATPAWSSGSPTIATSGLAFLSDPRWGTWTGSLVSATLKEQDLRRFTTADGGATFAVADTLFDGSFGRLRAATIGPDGALYLTTSNGSNDRVLRVVPGDAVIDRVGGVDRYATAAGVSAGTFGPGVPVVYIATGENYPDALAGGAAASHSRVPVLLVRSNAIPASTSAELLRLTPQRIVVLGGTGVISPGVEAALRSYTTGLVHRIAGANRYETAAAISRATFAQPVPAAYVATGLNYPDALAGVPAAAREGAPVLLVQPHGIPAATAAELDRLNPGRIVILGGPGVVSTTVQSQLRAYTSGPIVRRAGSDRYLTAVAISAGTFPGRVPHVFIATGLNYPDGLTGGPAAAFRGGPLLLVPGTTLPQAVADEIVRLDPDRVTLLGGSGVIGDEVRVQIDALLNP